MGETTCFPIRCFGKLAESVKIIKKGAKLFVEDKLGIAAFEGEDGDKRLAFHVLANTYRILDNKHHAGEGQLRHRRAHSCSASRDSEKTCGADGAHWHHNSCT